MAQKIVVEASELQLPPGRWPQALQYDGQSWRLVRQIWDENHEDLMAIVYVANGMELHVLND